MHHSDLIVYVHVSV